MRSKPLPFWLCVNYMKICTHQNFLLYSIQDLGSIYTCLWCSGWARSWSIHLVCGKWPLLLVANPPSWTRGENIYYASKLGNYAMLWCSCIIYNSYAPHLSHYAQRICHYAFEQNESLCSQKHLKLKNSKVSLLSHACCTEASVTFFASI